MTEKKKFLLRIDRHVYAVLDQWASDELRSINGQIEHLLVESARKSGRLKSSEEGEPPSYDPALG